eukprot:scaffold3917_cov377-Prasinococcus_capsulatus_cf.AAC.16
MWPPGSRPTTAMNPCVESVPRFSAGPVSPAARGPPIHFLTQGGNILGIPRHFLWGARSAHKMMLGRDQPGCDKP